MVKVCVYANIENGVVGDIDWGYEYLGEVSRTDKAESRALCAVLRRRAERFVNRHERKLKKES